MAPEPPPPPAWLGRLLRLLPPGAPGKARLARVLLGGRRRTAGPTLIECHHLRYHVPNIEEPIGFHLYIDGTYAPTEVDWILQQLQPGDTFVDVGANIGAFTIPAAHRVGPTGRVIAIEASPRVVDVLRRNVALNKLTNVTVVHAAAVARGTTAVTFYEAREYFGRGSVVETEVGPPITVPAVVVDELLGSLGISRVQVMKIDVEGGETGVLEGSTALISSPGAPIVLFEYIHVRSVNAGDVLGLLRQAGFLLWWLDDRVTGRAVEIGEGIPQRSGMIVATH